MRKLTVSTLRRQWGPLYRTQYGIVPAIRLNGHWLSDAGFTPGDKLSVKIEERTLVIQPEAVAAASPARA